MPLTKKKTIIIELNMKVTLDLKEERRELEEEEGGSLKLNI